MYWWDVLKQNNQEDKLPHISMLYYLQKDRQYFLMYRLEEDIL